MKYKCESCGGEYQFDPSTQQLKCVNCDNLLDFEKEQRSIEKRPFSSSSTITTNKQQYAQYECQSCGAKHIFPIDNPPKQCPACADNNLKRTTNIEYTPDGIIPFKIDKNKALNNFLSWIKRQKFTPNKLKNYAIASGLHGVYLPIYTFDFKCNTEYSGIGIMHHRDKNGHIHSTRDPFHSTRVDYYKDKIVSGCDFSSSTLQAISGPQKNVPFQIEYMYGYEASPVTNNLQTGAKAMKNDIAQSIATSIRFQSRYDYIENFSCNTEFLDMKYNYLYSPIYFGQYTYHGKPYDYYINGQTGKIKGKTPKSFWKIFFLTIGIVAMGGLIAFLIFNFFK